MYVQFTVRVGSLGKINRQEVVDDIVRDPAVSGHTIQTAIHVGDSLAASG